VVSFTPRPLYHQGKNQEEEEEEEEGEEYI
jgi:hypothetical protein